jgi:hypothetical protein
MQVGSLKIEFFVTTRSQPGTNVGEATYYWGEAFSNHCVRLSLQRR